MAGIGFELRKLLRSQSYLGLLRAYLYASIISSGPWVFSILGLMATGIISLGVVTPGRMITQFQVTVTYLIMGSLVLSGGLQLGFTRWVADRLFENRKDLIGGAYLGVMLVTTAVAGAFGLAVSLLAFQGVDAFYRVWIVLGFTLLCNLWITTAFLSGLKNYRIIVLLYALGYGASVAFASIGRPWGIDGLLAGFLGGQFLMWGVMLWLVLRNFPVQSPLSLECFRPGRMYTALLLGGTLYNLGIWIDKLVFWFDPGTSRPIIGALRASTIYDLPVFLAYLSVIPGMAVFLVKFETDFVEWYDEFYKTVRSGGTLGAIVGFRERMQDVVRDGLYQILKVQALTLLSLYTFVPSIFRLIGISELYTPLYMVQAVAASFQVMLLAVLNVFYYLDRRREVVMITAALALLNFSLSLLSIHLGSDYYGYGFAVSILCTLFFGLFLLQGLFRRLEYQTFMLQ